MRGRRGESINKKLAREAGLDAAGGVPGLAGGPQFPPPMDVAGIHGMARPRQWDVVASADAPELTGDEVHFVALPDGSLVVEEDVPDGSLSTLADAVEATLKPPYRAQGIRRAEQVWTVAALEIQVVEIAEDVPGDEVSLAVHDGVRTFLIDGEHAFGGLRELERLGEARSDAYSLQATRLDGDLWEVKLAPL